MSTVDQGKHRVRRNGDILYRFAHTQGRGVPGGFEDDGPRWVCIGAVQAVSGGWKAQKAGEPGDGRYESLRLVGPTMNAVVGGLKIHTRRCDAVAELLKALGLSSMAEAAAVSTMRSQAEVEAEVVALRSHFEAIKPNGGKALVERQNLSLRIAALEWVLDREDD